MKKWKSLLAAAIVPMTVGAMCSLTSCDGEKNNQVVPNKKVDYVSQAKLWTDYKGHDFEKDGIGQVSFAKHIDGDTTHAYALKNGNPDHHRLLKIRYLGVDTPESTGTIDMWAFDASDFTKEHTNPELSKYKTIVLSSDFKEFRPCRKDTNDRVLAYVWVGEGENCPFNELKLLNLMLVEKGFSSYKGAKDASMFDKLFYQAEEQAQKEGLYIWSDKKDPRYNYSLGFNTNLKDIVEGYKYIAKEDRRIKWDWANPDNNPEEYREQNGDCAKVRFDCTVAMTQEDNAYVYDDIDGHRYGMYVFAFFKNYGQVFKPMNRISICGSLKTHMGSLQVADISYNPAPFNNPEDMKIIEKNPKPGQEGHKEYEPVVFENIEEAKQPNNINVVCKINNLVPTGFYKKDLNNSIYTVGMKNETGKIDLRFERGLLQYDEKTIGHEKNDYNYKEFFKENGDRTFDIVGPLKKFNHDNGNSTWQVEAIKSKSVEVKDITKIQNTNNLFNGGNI